MDTASIRHLKRGRLTYSLGALIALALVSAGALFAFSPSRAADPTAVGIAGRVGVDPVLADSLAALAPEDLDPVAAAALAGTLMSASGEPAVWIGTERVVLHDDVVPFYRARSLAPVWDDPTVRDTLLHTLRDSALDGFDPEVYHASALTNLAAALDARERPDAPEADTVAADFDLALTDALFRYADDASGARTDPVELYAHLGMTAREAPTVASDLGAALDAEDPAAAIAALARGLQPQHAGYQNLRVALGRVLDGSAPDTLSADLLRLNLERWRWLPDDLGDIHVLVDVPGYRAWVRERDTTGFADSFEMDVVVGKPGRWQTPVMTDTMETIVFSPNWIIPASIQMESYGRVTPGRQQDPGPGNPMGRAKFLFPNDQAIYIHDTNSKWGFTRDYRALSHGCVRAADPRDFATEILTRTNGWTVDEVHERFEGPWRTESVTVDGTLPVHLTYFTAWADADGTVSVWKDVYSRDRPLAEALGLSLDA
ncbi:MAG: L,D-transpeptidase family protein [Bacteroidota bacterium]